MIARNVRLSITATLVHLMTSVFSGLLALQPGAPAFSGDRVYLSDEELRDRIRGGLLGELLGNLNGLPHEMRYLASPGSVAAYTPSLPHGAWTDDDSDIEWVYTIAMQKSKTLFLPPETVVELWKRHINTHIWCANHYARRLMDLGITPPLTGNPLLNPWADFNISGQFLCEAFGLISPGMPRKAARLGVHYTRTGISGEPAQATQLFTTMIATAFLTPDVDRVVAAGLSALDERSVLLRVVEDVRAWCKQHPEDWKKTRRLLLEKYAVQNGTGIRDRNGHELNTGSIIAALLYGRGRLDETLRMAFNFGWDADCNAATAGTIVGVMTGYRRIMAQGWAIVDRYENRTRPGMPEDETIVTYADRLIELAERNILDEGGSREGRGWWIPVQQPGRVEPLTGPREWREAILTVYPLRRIIQDVRSENPIAQARAAYLMLCLGAAGELRQELPAEWEAALAALQSQELLITALFRSPTPRGIELQQVARRAGLTP